MKNIPFFSVIVVSFNAETGIQGTIRSVLNQSFSDFEIIIKDGLSTDHTLEKVPSESRIKVYSEPDHGIYDAMNQAIGYANGKYAIFMNCGDHFYDNSVLERAYTRLKNYDNKVCLYGDFVRDEMRKKQTEQVTKYSLYRSSICHQTVFFDLEMLKTGYYYDTQYRIRADHDLEIKLFLSGAKYIYLDYPVCVYEGKGFSETQKGIEQGDIERQEIREKYFTQVEQNEYSRRYRRTLPGFRRILKNMCKNKMFLKLYRKATNIYYKISQ